LTALADGDDDVGSGLKARRACRFVRPIVSLRRCSPNILELLVISFVKHGRSKCWLLNAKLIPAIIEQFGAKNVKVQVGGVGYKVKFCRADDVKGKFREAKRREVTCVAFEVLKTVQEMREFQKFKIIFRCGSQRDHIFNLISEPLSP
jgi:hypothetical protein